MRISFLPMLLGFIFQVLYLASAPGWAIKVNPGKLFFSTTPLEELEFNYSPPLIISNGFTSFFLLDFFLLLLPCLIRINGARFHSIG